MTSIRFSTAPVLCFFTVMMLIITSSCESPVMSGTGLQTSMDASGRLEVNLLESEMDRSVMPEEYADEIAGYEVFLTGIQAMGPIMTEEPNLEIMDLPIGEYSLTASALDSSGRTLAAGSVSGVVVTEESDRVIDIELLPIMGGVGDISVVYDWSAAGFSAGHVDRVLALLTPVGGIPREVPVTISGNDLTFSDSIPTGTYTLSCELFSQGESLSSITETIRVFDGMETETLIEFGPEVFYTVPESPEAVEGVQDGMAVVLSWMDSSDLETGYRIFRSVDGGDFDIIGNDIPANTVSWTDEPVTPGRSYLYRVLAINDFGESIAEEVSVTIAPPVSVPEMSAEISDAVILGENNNQIPVEQLLTGFENSYNEADLEIIAVTLSGVATARIENGLVYIDASNIPFESDGEEMVLDFTVHIVGQPINDTYSAAGSVSLILSAPELEEIVEEDLLTPVVGYIYDDRDEMEMKMRLYDPPDPEEIFNNWGRISNQEYYENVADAEASRETRNDMADMASWWKLKGNNGGSYIEYAKNSVYAGLVSPDGEESDNFILEATVGSKDDDDDVVGLIVAYVRDGDANYLLEAARSHGASSGDRVIGPENGWGLLVRRLDDDSVESGLGEIVWSRQLDIGGISSGGWKGSVSRIRIERSGDLVTVSASDWNDVDSYVPDSIISVDLGSEGVFNRFRGPRKFGYFVASQERSSFTDIVLNGGVIQDKLFLVDPETGDSEVWWYDRYSHRWIRMSGASLQSVLGYPLEITNPETGKTFMIERQGFSRGNWDDWRDRWKRWNQWDSKKLRAPE